MQPKSWLFPTIMIINEVYLSSLWTPCVSCLFFFVLSFIASVLHSVCIVSLCWMSFWESTETDGLFDFSSDAITARYTDLALSSFPVSPPLWLSSLSRFPVAGGISEAWNDERCKSRQRKSVFRNSLGKSENIDDNTKSPFLPCFY